MVFFGRVKFLDPGDLGDDRAVKDALFIFFLPGFLCKLALLVGVLEDGRAVLGAYIISLLVQGGRVM